jgi:hypothetical protein
VRRFPVPIAALLTHSLLLFRRAPMFGTDHRTPSLPLIALLKDLPFKV